MLVLHEGIFAADKGVLLSSANNHVARHRGMFVLVNGVLMSSKEVFLPHKRKCLCHSIKCLAQALQAFSIARASSSNIIKECLCQAMERLFEARGS